MSSAKREVERIGARIKKLLNLMLDDEIAVDEGKAEIELLEARRKELQAQLKTADEPSRFCTRSRHVSPEGDDGSRGALGPSGANSWHLGFVSGMADR